MMSASEKIEEQLAVGARNRVFIVDPDDHILLVRGASTEWVHVIVVFIILVA